VTVFDDIRAMVTGWEKVEIHDELAEAGETPAEEHKLSPSTGEAQA